MAERQNTNDPKIRREYFWSAFGFTVAAPLYVWFSLSDMADTAFMFWLGIVGAGSFTVMALLAWLSFFRDWSVEKSDRILMRAMGWLLASPFVAGLLVVLLVGAVLAGQWLLQIPSWAAAIIVLLMAILFQIRRR